MKGFFSGKFAIQKSEGNYKMGKFFKKKREGSKPSPFIEEK